MSLKDQVEAVEKLTRRAAAIFDLHEEGTEHEYVIEISATARTNSFTGIIESGYSVTHVPSKCRGKYLCLWRTDTLYTFEEAYQRFEKNVAEMIEEGWILRTRRTYQFGGARDLLPTLRRITQLQET